MTPCCTYVLPGWPPVVGEPTQPEQLALPTDAQVGVLGVDQRPQVVSRTSQLFLPRVVRSQGRFPLSRVSPDPVRRTPPNRVNRSRTACVVGLMEVSGRKGLRG